MFQFEGLGKLLVIAGIFLVLFGLLFTFWHRVPLLGNLGKLPGDIIIQKGGFHFFFPLVTCLVISRILTIALNLVFRLFR